MKLTCDMVTDLYPLYKDGLASSDTREAIKEHLSACDECRNFYRRYPFGDKLLRRSAADSVDNPTHTSSVTDSFCGVAAKIKKSKRIKLAVAFVVTAILAVAALFKILSSADK